MASASTDCIWLSEAALHGKRTAGTTESTPARACKGLCPPSIALHKAFLHAHSVHDIFSSNLHWTGWLAMNGLHASQFNHRQVSIHVLAMPQTQWVWAGGLHLQALSKIAPGG